MLQIKDYEVYGLERAVIARGLPMTTNKEPVYNESRAKILGNAPTGSGHDSFLKGVTVVARIKYPLYISKQLQRYHFMDIVSSQSTMHRITKMDLDNCFNEYTSKAIIDIVKSEVDIYNWMINNEVEYIYLDENEIFRPTIPDNGKFETYDRYKVFMRIVSNCPCGLEMEMEIVTNYLQLKTIYNQRKNHKLKEDWGSFCDWIKSLPLLCNILEEENK